MGKTVCLARAALAYSMEGELSETLLSDLPVQQPLVEEKPRSKWSIKCDKSLWLNMLYISAFSYLGVMARKACEKLCEDEQSGEDVWQLPVVYQIFFGSTVFGGHAFFLANVLGCVVMGHMSKVQTLVTSSGTHGPYLYVGITTGFCGCLTTFATWNQNISQAASRSNTFDTVDSVPVAFGNNLSRMHWFDAYFLLVVQFMLFYASLIFGQIVGEALYAVLKPKPASQYDTADQLQQSTATLLVEQLRQDIRRTTDALSQSTALTEGRSRNTAWAADILPETQIEGYITVAEEAARNAARAVDAERSANELPVVQESEIHVYITLGCLAALTVLSWCLSYLTTED